TSAPRKGRGRRARPWSTPIVLKILSGSWAWFQGDVLEHPWSASTSGRGRSLFFPLWFLLFKKELPIGNDDGGKPLDVFWNYSCSGDKPLQVIQAVLDFVCHKNFQGPIAAVQASLGIQQCLVGARDCLELISNSSLKVAVCEIASGPTNPLGKIQKFSYRFLYVVSGPADSVDVGFQGVFEPPSPAYKEQQARRRAGHFVLQRHCCLLCKVH
ncbi:mCG141895, partial [Mus musculus]